MALTAEQMEQECIDIATGVALIIRAGLDKDLSVIDKVTALVEGGLSTFGAVGDGLDQDANPARVAIEVAGHTCCILASELLPLTTED